MFTMHNPVRWVDPTGLFASDGFADWVREVGQGGSGQTGTPSRAPSTTPPRTPSRPGADIARNALGLAGLGGSNPVPWTAIEALAYAAASFATAMTAMKITVATTVVGFWIPIVGKIKKVAAGIAIGAVAGMVVSYAVSATEALTWANAQIDDGGISHDQTRGHSVYVLRGDNTGRAFYVGRTLNTTRREAEHLRDPRFAHRRPFHLMPLQTGLTESEARALEQGLIIGFTINAIDNKINSIARGNFSKFADEFDYVNTLFRIVD